MILFSLFIYLIVTEKLSYQDFSDEIKVRNAFCDRDDDICQKYTIVLSFLAKL